MSNYYWPTYKSLEKEVLKISDYIHFSDDQVNVYSLHIADLIVRCAIEIESLSKELYSLNSGNMSPVDSTGALRDLYFDTDCIEFLDQKFKITKKQVNVIATSFYFEEKENKTITPLHKSNKRGTSGSQWKQAYQGVKHDRKNWLKRATIKNLLYALGALYILNVYYKNDKPFIVGRIVGNQSDLPADSEIFSAVSYSVCAVTRQAHMNDTCIIDFDNTEYEKAIYIKKIADHSFKEIHDNFIKTSQEIDRKYRESKKIQAFLQTHPEFRGKGAHEVCMAAGGQALVNELLVPKTSSMFINEYIELKLNRHENIYPDLV